MCTYIHNTHMHLFYLFVAMHAVGAAIYDEKYMPRLVAPLIFFLLFFVFLRPITKARPPRRPPLPFSPFLFLSFLTRHPSFLHAWHETSLWWSRLETFTAALSIAIESRSLFTFGLNDRARTRALSSLPPKVVRYFFMFQLCELVAGMFSSTRTILDEYRFRDSLLRAFSVSLFFDSMALFASFYYKISFYIFSYKKKKKRFVINPKTKSWY